MGTNTEESKYRLIQTITKKPGVHVAHAGPDHPCLRIGRHDRVDWWIRQAAGGAVGLPGRPPASVGQVRAQLDRWAEEVAPGAVGWLGSTSGVTDDGRLIALARFESDEAARQNSDRPEQTAWWEQTALFTGEPVFHNSTSVGADTPGDPSQAGFVQVMQGRSSDPDPA
jgi:hypothetical protein